MSKAIAVRRQNLLEESYLTNRGQRKGSDEHFQIQGKLISVVCSDPTIKAQVYLTFSCNQSPMYSAISLLFFSSIIIWPLPGRPSSSMRTYSVLTPA